MHQYTRRTFLKASAVTAAALGVSSRARANDHLRLAVIGCGSQGRRHARTFASFDDCDIVAVADLDPGRRAQAVNEVRDHGKPDAVDDFRRILDRDDIDAVSVATPDHWHAPVALAAMQAGKHVYLEKPCAHNINETKALVDAIAKTGLHVQHGTQSRSSEGIRAAIEFIQSGAMGKVRAAKAINHQLRRPIGTAKPKDPPPGVDYDLWLGPAPEHPFTENRWHYNWHWFWDYGTGDMGNDGIHQIDVARWGLGVEAPNRVVASGGQLFYNDDHQTPDTQMVTFEYDDCHLYYEMRLFTDYKLEGHDNGTVFYGDEGRVEIGRAGSIYYPKDGEPRRLGGGKEFDGHLRNFIDAIKAGNSDQLNAPIRDAFYSTNLCHLGNIGTRVGRVLVPDLEKLQCAGDQEATAMFTRDYRSGYELPLV